MNFPRNGQSTKVPPRAFQRFIHEAPKEPRRTSKELQTVNCGKVATTADQNMALLTFIKKHLDDRQDFWNNILWIDESKLELLNGLGII